MRLGEWIEANMEKILARWEHDATQILPSGGFSPAQRRDHAQAMMERIAVQMAEPQTTAERYEIAKGHSTRRPGKTGAQRHGLGRMRSGADVLHVTTEFRALRLSVIELWSEDTQPSDQTSFADLMRFDQAIDQALSESVESFAAEKDKQARLLLTTLSSMPDPSYVLDLDGCFIYANKAATELYRAPLEKLAGRRINDLGLPISDNLFRDIERVIQSRAQVRDELTMPDLSGKRRYYEYIHAPVIDDEGQVEALVGTARDITERREAEALIWHHANHDPLTQLPNRRLFRDRLDQHTLHAERTGAAFALFFIDLDRFKEVNDRLGHDKGDQLLQQAAQRICDCVRETDTVARLGGDEFTIILLDIDDQEQIKQIALQMLDKLAVPFPLGEDSGSISGSIGITCYPQDARTPSQLLNNADQAMYAAKNNGRNQFCFYSQVKDHGTTARARFISELREAVSKNQFQLLYQPIVNLANGGIAKAEVLLRWRHPTHGLLLPADFIPLAEEIGLIGDIESWVFTQATETSKQWQATIAPHLQISLNLSAREFCHQNSEIAWASELEKLGLSGSGFAIELTEKIFSEGTQSLAEKLSRLEKAGISVSLDDFGTGQFSMAYLKQFPIDYLKIAPMFVQSEEVNKTNRTIAETIIVMAHLLDIEVIAEGVETRQQKDWLRDAGCDYAQGFFFSPPLPDRSFEKILSKGYISASSG
ncbi:MAG: EAL domain-containing protein [Oleiphilaceae bacterium]|nr:EAL domain-containing protein [Oleiphilaceae bacterium]